MIRITQIKLRTDSPRSMLEEKIRKLLRLRPEDSFTFEIVRQSLDARRRPEIFYVYSADVSLSSDSAEKKALARCRGNHNVTSVRPVRYRFPKCGGQETAARPVIVGSGPAGLFCALLLAQHGFRPILLERGGDVDERADIVERFWAGEPLDPETNVQFGEGGAGTFSDGKLNSVIKDPKGRVRFVLETFVRMGADPDILYSYKPHIGTDRLRDVVRRLRTEIISLGGEVRFHHRLDQISERDREGFYTLTVQAGEQTRQMKARVLILATGHSARDTVRMLYAKGIPMQPKAFAAGVRVQHPQSMIDDAMYGKDHPDALPASPYKLTCTLEKGSVYSFCMCPGGYVVNASSQPGRLAVNGMSLRARDGENANSAIVVGITPDQFTFEENRDQKCAERKDAAQTDPLIGIAFQEELERRAFESGDGAIPTQLFGDFAAGRPSVSPGKVTPRFCGKWKMTDLRGIFPPRINECIEQAMHEFGRVIPGFDDNDTLLSAVESRTSSPVRIERDETLQIPGFPGIYPCGEGAGYAGGITSAAVDGIRVAEAVGSLYSEV